jgi:hypothetical protein
MSTPDGISTQDWDGVHELAVDLVNADEEQSEECRVRLLRYLDKLEEKYGELPSILATRADYIDDQREGAASGSRVWLAETRGDARNAFYVAHSLAQLYIEELKDATEGRRWLERTQQHMIQVDDGNYVDDLERFRDALQQPSRPGVTGGSSPSPRPRAFTTALGRPASSELAVTLIAVGGRPLACR